MAFSAIFDSAVRDLVQAVTDASGTSARDELLVTLVRRLRTRCARPEVQARYAAYPSLDGVALSRYPVDGDGYARSFDPLTEEEAFWECFRTHGVVVGREIASPVLCAATRLRMHEVMTALSGGAVHIEDPATHAAIPADANGASFVSRGFFELYHDQAMANLRQNLRMYLHHVAIWGRADLWTTFDRLGLKLAGHGESGALPLHVDQNPRVHPEFRTLQGVLALADCPLERGTFVAVPGSRAHFADYTCAEGYTGEFVELLQGGALYDRLAPHAQPLPLRGGDLVSWDSRTTHTNTANLSAVNRYVAYLSAGPAREDDPAAVATRAEAFRSGLGSNVRDALMHASKKPRFTDEAAMAKIRQPEALDALGRLLYGQASYTTL